MALVDRIFKAGSSQKEIVVIPGSIQGLPKTTPFEEVGVSGLLRTRGTGYVFEEWLADLSTYRQKQIYREMRDNDAVIGSMFFALEMILRRAEWRVEPAKGAKGDDIAEFIKTCLDDMSHTFEDFVAECTSEFAFGFSLFETIYKRRRGPDGRKASRFDDGLIGWRKFAPRAQESILYWIWDEEGGLQGAVQLAAPDYKTVPIPIDKLLLFRTTSLKNNPEGRSMLRNCYRCFDAETEILTRGGWKKGLDLDGSEEVAVWNSSRKELYEKPSEIHRYGYEGDLVHFESSLLDQAVTPNHEVWVSDHGVDFHRVRADESRLEFHEVSGPGCASIQLSRPDAIFRSSYKGPVWCVTTKSGVVYVRRNGKGCWSGNSWFFKRRIEEVEGIGIERDLCGLPILYASAEALASMGGMGAAKKLVTNIRMDDQAGVVLPMAFDDNKNPMVKLELLRSGGTKVADVNAAITRYNQDMLNTILAGFVQFGEAPHGSRALHLSATAIFSEAISAFMDSIAAVLNRIAIPRLMALNQMDLKFAPRLIPGEVGVRDLNELSEYVSRLAQSGLTFFDSETSAYLRKVARLPDEPDMEEPPPPGAAVSGTPLVPIAPEDGGPQPPPTPDQVPPASKAKPEAQGPTPGSSAAKPQGAAAPTNPADAKGRLQGVA